MAGKAIGLCKCPECDNENAEVKPQRNGLVYRFCPGCKAQYFPRTPETSDRLRAKMRPDTVTDTAPAAPSAPVEEVKPQPVPAPMPKAPRQGKPDDGQPVVVKSKATPEAVPKPGSIYDQLFAANKKG